MNFEVRSTLGCGLCHENYSTEEGHLPLVLHGCGHTICQSCCTALLGAACGRATHIVCPFDRIKTPAADNNALSLNKNYALMEVIERERHVSTPILADEETDFTKDMLLGIKCDENPAHTAVFYCTVCSSNLCAHCSAITHTGRVLSKHNRVRLVDKPVPKTMCPYHSAYAIEFVCQDVNCEAGSRLMCLLCREYGRHQRHHFSLLEVEAAALRERVREALSDFRNFIIDLNAWNTRVTQAVAEIEDSSNGSHVRARDQVEAHFRNLRVELDVQEQAALMRLDNHVSDRVTPLRQYQRELATIAAQVSAVSTQLQESAVLEDARLVEQQSDLAKMFHAIRTYQHDIASAPSGLSLDARIPFSFTADNKIHMGSNVDIRMVILGLDGAGKTTILYKWKNEDCRVNTISTVGFNVETIQYKNFKLTMWDVGGMTKLRPLWRHYFMNTQALVFVIDSSCPSRFVEAQCELMKIFAEKELADTCFLVILNRKQQFYSSRYQCEIDSAAIDQLVMNINRFGAGHSVLIHQCNAMTGIGLWEALDSLTSKLLLKRKQSEILNKSSMQTNATENIDE